ncbi:hypothetical protein [Leptospira santarosai]|uniref:hypothetical protein n=1 Tax=Leptospira santarosai TaxID=28183 RepID=UPI003D16265E
MKSPYILYSKFNITLFAIIIYNKNEHWMTPNLRISPTQSYIIGCPKFCFKTEIGLKMNGTVFYL